MGVRFWYQINLGVKCRLFTLSNSSITIETIPRIVSLELKLPIFWYTFSKQSKKLLDSNFNPRRLFSWDTAIITDVADVKPTVTGMEMKSINTPEKKKNIYMKAFQQNS